MDDGSLARRKFVDRIYGEKICKICSKSFVAKSSRTEICGTECRRINANSVSKKRRDVKKRPRKVTVFSQKSCDCCKSKYIPTSNRQKICTGCLHNKKLKTMSCCRCKMLFQQTNGRNYACESCRVLIANEIRKQHGLKRYLEKKSKTPEYARGFSIKFCVECFSNFKPAGANQKYCKLCAANRVRESIRTRRVEKKHTYAIAGKAWRQRNLQKLRRCQLVRYSTDLSYRISCSLRAVMRQAFDAAYVKKPRFVDVIGIDSESFVEYLVNHPLNHANRFTKDNYGTFWSIDHVRPIASFDLSDVEQQKQAFHYTNCQPMEKSMNLQKSSLWNGSRWSHKSHRNRQLDIT